MKTKVIFLIQDDQGSEPFALFPEEPYVDGRADLCWAYARVGQHSGADPKVCFKFAKVAREGQYADLKAELEDIGYELEVVDRYDDRFGIERRRRAAAI